MELLLANFILCIGNQLFKPFAVFDIIIKPVLVTADGTGIMENRAHVRFDGKSAIVAIGDQIGNDLSDKAVFDACVLLHSRDYKKAFTPDLLIQKLGIDREKATTSTNETSSQRRCAQSQNPKN